MKNFIDALNSINSQVWAFLMLCIGLSAALLFHRAGLDIAIAAGVIGAAVQLFQTTNKPQTASVSTPGATASIGTDPTPSVQATSVTAKETL